MYQISDHTSSLTIVAIETKNIISGDSGSNIIITLYCMWENFGGEIFGKFGEWLAIRQNFPHQHL